MINRTPIWLDCDPGIDDTMAIILSSYNPKLQLLGISSAPGNSSSYNTARNALKVLKMINKEHITVIEGSKKSYCRQITQWGSSERIHGKNGLMIEFQSMNETIFDQIIRQDFEQQIYDYFKQYYQNNSQKVTLIVTGPATNIAYVMEKYHDFGDYVEQIVMMGGGIGLGNVTKYAEYNVWSDPSALNVLLKQSKVNVVMVPLNATRMIRRQESYYQKLEQNGSYFCSQIYHALRFYQQTCNNKKIDENVQPACHDDFTVFYLIDRSHFQCQQMRLKVVEDGERKGELQQTDDHSYALINVAMAVNQDSATVFNQVSLQSVLDADRSLKQKHESSDVDVQSQNKQKTD